MEANETAAAIAETISNLVNARFDLHLAQKDRRVPEVKKAVERITQNEARLTSLLTSLSNGVSNHGT